MLRPDSIRLDILNMNMLVSEVFSLDMLELDAGFGSTAGTLEVRMETGSSRMGLSMEIDANLLNFTQNELSDRRMLLVIEDTL
jgi:hypothetical protein